MNTTEKFCERTEFHIKSNEPVICNCCPVPPRAADTEQLEKLSFIHSTIVNEQPTVFSRGVRIQMTGSYTTGTSYKLSLFTLNAKYRARIILYKLEFKQKLFVIRHVELAEECSFPAICHILYKGWGMNSYYCTTSIPHHVTIINQLKFVNIVWRFLTQSNSRKENYIL